LGTLEQEHVAPLWSVQNRPGFFTAPQAVTADGSDGCFEIRNFEEEHGLVFRRIGFAPPSFSRQINPTWLSNFARMPSLLLGNLQSQDAGRGTFRLWEMVEVEFDSDRAPVSAMASLRHVP